MYVILLAVVIFVSVALSGLLAPPFPDGQETAYLPEGYTCCDTGDRDDCRAQTEKPPAFYKGERYALLKSDMYFHQYNKNLTDEHLDPAVPRVETGPRNERVFINPSQGRNNVHAPECDGSGGFDQLYGEPVPGERKPGCYKIPDDLLIYLCRSDSPGCQSPRMNPDGVKFDTYIRVKDVQESGIPNVIKNCYKPEVKKTGEKVILFEPSPGGQKNLQLRTFNFEEPILPVTWLSPYCKPAVYLYPERKTEINVKVAPKGEMLLTIPEYPSAGWDVVAEPNGDIFHHNTRFDYLYYEASIPDELIHKPEEGYVISYDKREAFMRDLVVKLGLNKKETDQFVEYWAPILPEAPYYFIGIVPVTNLDAISPVTISPKPDNFIRITLYFQALDNYKIVQEPTIPVVKRDGFTAVEWGGIFKQDEKHSFSCFM